MNTTISQRDTIASNVNRNASPSTARSGDPERAEMQYQRWRTALAKTALGEPGAALDRPDRRLTMLRVFGETKRLSDLCMTYPAAAATTLLESPATVLAETARHLTALDWGMGGADALHAALSPLKERADLAIAIALIAGEWDVHQAAASRTDLAERICETALSWLVRGAVKRGELALPEEEASSGSGMPKGLFLLAGGDFAHEDCTPLGPLEMVVVYDPDAFKSAIPNSNERALIRIGAEFREAIEGRAGGYPLFHLHTPFGSKLNGAGLVEPVPAIMKILSAPQSELVRNWVATARVVAGDRALGGHFMEQAEPHVWNDKPMLTQEMTDQYLDKSKDALETFRSISQLCRLTMGRMRPLFRTASAHDVLASAAQARMIPAAIANRLLSGHEFARMLDTIGQVISGRSVAADMFAQENSSSEINQYFDHLANLTGFGNGDSLVRVMQGVSSDAENALHQLLYGPRNAFKRYASNSVTLSGDSEKLEDLGFLDGGYVCAMVERWINPQSGIAENNVDTDDPVRFSAQAPGLLTAFGETQYPTKAIKLFDCLVENCPNNFDLFSILDEGSVKRERLVDALGCFPEATQPLMDTSDGIRLFLDDVVAIDTTKPLSADDWFMAHPTPTGSNKSTVEDLASWRTRCIAQVAFGLASGLHNFAEAVSILSQVHLRTLKALFSILQNGAYKDDAKLFNCLALFECKDEWQAIPGDQASIGFILTRKKKDSTLIERAVQFAHDYTAALQKMGSGIFGIAVDLSRRPGGVSGPLVSDLASWEQFVRTEAVAMEQIALARTQVIAGAEKARTLARGVLREVVANHRRTELTLRDLDRTRMQKRMRASGPSFAAGSSVWDIDSLDGGWRDVELIIKVLFYRHGAAHPYLQELSTGEALHAMAEAGLIEAEIASTLNNARIFWASVGLVKTFSGWSTPEIAPVRKRFAKVLARAAGVEAFDQAAPLIRGYADDGARLYARLVLGRGGEQSHCVA